VELLIADHPLDHVQVHVQQPPTGLPFASRTSQPAHQRLIGAELFKLPRGLRVRCAAGGVHRRPPSRAVVLLAMADRRQHA
jgi:hypothetical protein